VPEEPDAKNGGSLSRPTQVGNYTHGIVESAAVRRKLRPHDARAAGRYLTARFRTPVLLCYETPLSVFEVFDQSYTCSLERVFLVPGRT
jgi:hypothetical protein